jgi:hypothetical protein
MRGTIGLTHEFLKEMVVVGLEAAFELDDLGAVEELLSAVESEPPGRSSLFLRAHAARFRARLEASRGESDERVEEVYRSSVRLFRELAMPFYLAVTQLEYAGWLRERERAEEAELLLGEARLVFERLRATPWLDRVDAVAPLVATP